MQQVDAQLRFEQSWADIQGYLLTVLDVAGVDPVAAEELTVIPGAEEVLALLGAGDDGQLLGRQRVHAGHVEHREQVALDLRP